MKFIGVGEKATDLLVFDKKEFVNSLFENVAAISLASEHHEPYARLIVMLMLWITC